MPRLQYEPMAIILDANSLINLHKAGLLVVVYNQQNCIITAEVYAEVVTRGLSAGHRDANEIADIIGSSTSPPTEILPEMAQFGIGEASILSQYVARQTGESASPDLIVSDDRQFLSYLSRRATQYGSEIPHLTTAGFIAGAGVSRSLDKAEALAALERIRGLTRETDYQSARQLLETL